MSSQQTPFSYFGTSDGLNNIWSSDKCVGSCLFKDARLIQSRFKGKFVYKSSDMVRTMSPGGTWSTEIVDNEHIIFRRAHDDEAVIRPGKKLNVVLFSILFMNVFYSNILSYLLMFTIWSSVLCIQDPNNEEIHSWSSLLPQMLRMIVYLKNKYIELNDSIADRILMIEIQQSRADNEMYCDYSENSYEDDEDYIYNSDSEDIDNEDSGSEYEDSDSDSEDSDSDSEDECEDSDSGSEDGDSGSEDDDEDGGSEDDDEDNNSEDSGDTHSSMPDLIDYDTNNRDDINSLYDNIYYFHTTNDNFIYWVKSGENGIISDEYFDEDDSDENWLYALAELCCASDITFVDVTNRFTTDTKDFDENKTYPEEEEEDENEWDMDINASEFIKPVKGGMWLRSMR